MREDTDTPRLSGLRCAKGEGDVRGAGSRPEGELGQGWGVGLCAGTVGLSQFHGAGSYVHALQCHLSSGETQDGLWP